jgi:hypothetical protein
MRYIERREPQTSTVWLLQGPTKRAALRGYLGVATLDVVAVAIG